MPFVIYCHNPTQQQPNLTRLRLDTIINPNPPHPTPHKLSKPAVVTAWRQHNIRLFEELATEWYKQVQEGTHGYARVHACTRVYKLVSCQSV